MCGRLLVSLLAVAAAATAVPREPPRRAMQAKATSACAAMLKSAYEGLQASGAENDTVWGTALDDILNSSNCTAARSGLAPGTVFSWLRYPAFFNGLSWRWIQDLQADAVSAIVLKGAVFDAPDGLPPLSAITSASSMKDYAAIQESKKYALTTFDLSGVSEAVALARTFELPEEENVCVDDRDPRGPLYPRTYLVTMYRPDVVTQLHAAGRISTPRPPDDWDGLLTLVQAHADARSAAAAAAATNATRSVASLPQYGLCVTTDPDCGRLGDVFAAIAASIMQYGGTSQGYLYDFASSPQACTPLANSTGWKHAAEVLRALLAYNAPAVLTPSGQTECTDVSQHFKAGDCLVTLEWDATLTALANTTVGRQPGSLGVAPLPGSRRVQDRRSGSSTAGALVPCSWDLCAASANHDLLYLGQGVGSKSSSGNSSAAAAAVLAAAQALEPLTAAETVLVNGAQPRNCDVRAVLAVEAAAAGRVLTDLAEVVQRGEVPVNRAPYSAYLDGWIIFHLGDSAAALQVVSAVSRVVSLRVAGEYALLRLANDEARAGLGYTAATNGTSDGGGGALYQRYRWWRALAGPFNTSRFVAEGMDEDASLSHIHTAWYNIHAPNGAPDAASPSSVNFIKWGLSYTALLLAPGTGASPVNATSALAGVLSLVADAFGQDAVRAQYVASINANTDAPKPQASSPAGSGGSPSGLSTEQVVGLLVGVIVAGAIALLALFLLWRRRGQHRDLLGRVLAPRVGPDTSLMISDVQNSTRLWEDLSVETMDTALRLHHQAIRRALAAHCGYESATEGDSFIAAFASPASACAFAAEAQLALLHEDWPAELLAHPDGAVVFVARSDTALNALGSAAAAQPISRNPERWTPFCAVRAAWVRVSGSGGSARLGRMPSKQHSTVSSEPASSYGQVLSDDHSRRARRRSDGSGTSEQHGADAAVGGGNLFPTRRESGTPTFGKTSDGSAHGTPRDSLHERSSSVVDGDAVAVSSTWANALAAAFPLAAADAKPSTPRQCTFKGAHAAYGHRTLCFRGLRVRMGIHSGLNDPAHIVFNKVGSAYKYYGPFAETAKLVGDCASGGLVVLSAHAFARLRNTAGAEGKPADNARALVVVYAGHHLLEAAPTKPSPQRRASRHGAPAEPAGAEHVAIELTSPVSKSDASESDAEDAPLGVPLFAAVPADLLCRLVHCPPLRTVRSLAPGTLAAPTGSVVIAFMKVVGAQTLLVELPEAATHALEQLQRLACRLLAAAGGYLVEGGDGLVLAAFGSALAAVEWALDVNKGLKSMAWEEELLAHELCAEVLTIDVADLGPVHGTASGNTRKPLRAFTERIHSTQGAERHRLPPRAATSSRDSSQRTSRLSSNSHSPPPGASASAGASAHAQPPEPARKLTLSRKAVECGLRVKVGLDVGPVTYSLTESSGRLSYRGKVMNRAARVAGTAAPGQVLASGAVWTAAEAGLVHALQSGSRSLEHTGPVGVRLGHMSLKGVAAPMEVVLCTRESYT